LIVVRIWHTVKCMSRYCNFLFAVFINQDSRGQAKIHWAGFGTILVACSSGTEYPQTRARIVARYSATVRSSRDPPADGWKALRPATSEDQRHKPRCAMNTARKWLLWVDWPHTTLAADATRRRQCQSSTTMRGHSHPRSRAPALIFLQWALPPHDTERQTLWKERTTSLTAYFARYSQGMFGHGFIGQGNGRGCGHDKNAKTFGNGI
jgi:hypothetical protein